MDTPTIRDNAPEVPPDHDQDRPHACYSGVVYIGHLVEHDGEEVEVIVTVPCRRCADSR